MGDLFLHLGFARRLRFAEGLHPLAVETLVRRPDAVALGASLSLLPGLEHKGTSFLRRLLMSGKQKRAFWLKALAPADKPRLELAIALLDGDEPKAPGAMARFALTLGALAHEVLHDRISETTAGLEGPELDAVQRAQARLWLAAALADPAALAAELRPVLQLDDGSAKRRLVDHLGRALGSAFGQSPGSDVLSRWVKGLCAEVEPIVQREVMPASLSLSDDEARGPRYEEARFEDRVADATTWLVSLANRLAPLHLGHEPSAAEVKEALTEDGGLARPADSGDLPSFVRDLEKLREEHLERGRNPRPAYDVESGAVLTAPAGMPPVPVDTSGPSLSVPAHTQEVSVGDIQSAVDELQRESFPAPAHTQEVSVAQIEEEEAGSPHAAADEREANAAAPKHTQQVSLEQIEEEMASEDKQGEEPAAEPPALAPPPTPDPSAPFRAGAVPVPSAPTAPVAEADLQPTEQSDEGRELGAANGLEPSGEGEQGEADADEEQRNSGSDPAGA